MKKKLIAIAAAAVAVVPFTASPAPAAGGGNVAITCNAHLPQFPTAAGHGTCNGTAVVAPLPGRATGGITGVIGTTPFALVTDPTVSGNFTAEFDYNEGCVANEPPAVGTAFNATATITGLEGKKGTADVTAEATVQFEWTRVGLTAAVVITGGEINFSDGSSAGVAAGAATAAFVPFLTLSNTCAGSGALEAYVVADATIAGV